MITNYLVIGLQVYFSAHIQQQIVFLLYYYLWLCLTYKSIHYGVHSHTNQQHWHSWIVGSPGRREGKGPDHCQRTAVFWERVRELSQCVRDRCAGGARGVTRWIAARTWRSTRPTTGPSTSRTARGFIYRGWFSRWWLCSGWSATWWLLRCWRGRGCLRQPTLTWRLWLWPTSTSWSACTSCRWRTSRTTRPRTGSGTGGLGGGSCGSAMFNVRDIPTTYNLYLRLNEFLINTLQWWIIAKLCFSTMLRTFLNIILINNVLRIVWVWKINWDNTLCLKLWVNCY